MMLAAIEWIQRIGAVAALVIAGWAAYIAVMAVFASTSVASFENVPPDVPAIAIEVGIATAVAIIFGYAGVSQWRGHVGSRQRQLLRTSAVIVAAALSAGVLGTFALWPTLGQELFDDGSIVVGAILFAGVALGALSIAVRRTTRSVAA